MTQKERVVEDMDTYTVFGLKSRGYGHGEEPWKSRTPYYRMRVWLVGRKKVCKRFCLFIINSKYARALQWDRNSLYYGRHEMVV
jgi:hypothetical protein